MNKKIQTNLLPLFIYVIFLAGGIWGLIHYPKADLHLLLNGGVAENNLWHTPVKDVFFLLTTTLGEWVPFVIIGILMFFKFGHGICALSIQLLSSIITRIIKHSVQAPRPFRFFAENYPDITLPLPENFIPHSSLSFPSGHTASVFSLVVFLILITPNKWLKTLFLLVGILVGYSRIYLSQHFALDVVVGSLIGTLAALLLYLIFPQEKKWYQFSPYQWIRKRKSA